MAQQNDDVFNDDPKNTTETGSNAAHGDGTVSDEDVNSIGQANKDGKPIGQDHSTENREDQMPRDGVGAIQDANLIKENIAHIADDEE